MCRAAVSKLRFYCAVLREARSAGFARIEVPDMSFLLWGFPQFNAIAVGIGDPGESAEVGFLAVWIDFHACGFHFHQQRVEIVDSIIHHETGLARTEMFCARGKN